MSIDFRTVARTPLQYAPQATERQTVRRQADKRALVGSNYSFQELVPFEMPLPTEDRRSHGDPARRRHNSRRPQSAQPFRSIAEQNSSSLRLTSGGSAASLGTRPSTAPLMRRRPSSGLSGRSRPTSGGAKRLATQRPWVDGQLRAEEGGQLIFAKLRALENATTQDVASERLAACSELFDAVIRVDKTYGAVLQRVKLEYDDAISGGLIHGDSSWVDGADGSLADNYARLSKEYTSQQEQVEAQALELKVVSEQYDIVVKQWERLAVEHEADQRKISEQREAIVALEKAAEMTNTAAAQRRSMDLASAQISSTDHVHKLEKLVQELAQELDAARSTEATALRELVALRALLGEPDVDEASAADWPAMDMAEREHSAAALQGAALWEQSEVSDEPQGSSLMSETVSVAPTPGGPGCASSELSGEDAASIASTLGSGSELASLASSRPAVPRPAAVPALDTSAASLASEVEGMTADGHALAAQREAAAQSEALAQADGLAATSPTDSTPEPSLPSVMNDVGKSADTGPTAAIEAFVSPKACEPLDESTEHGAHGHQTHIHFSVTERYDVFAWYALTASISVDVFTQCSCPHLFTATVAAALSEADAALSDQADVETT